MADKASSSSNPCSSNHWIYDVFLSFRGEDTRNSFTGHLYLALKEAGINAFIDDKELKRGEIINEELVRAIQGSRICVIVFSRRYADSSWCLDELVRIMECRTTPGQLVLPVFYDVDPSVVRKQSGSYAEAFDQKHGDKDEDKVKGWRAALTEAANLSGWDLRTKADGHEGNFIRMIVQEISKFLNNTDLKVADNEVGIDSRMQDIISLLGIGATSDVRIVGICGMGGIGKTTVAKALYNKFRQSFEASSFQADVRETMQKNGARSFQESLISDISSMTDVGLVDRGINVIKDRLQCRRVFLVIDDVDQLEQLKALAIDRDSFAPGSRVLITTRDEHLLKQLGVDFIYQARVMDREEAFKFFTLHAFKTHCPNEEYVELSKRVVDCCGGLPLALKVLGSFLLERTTEFWESEISKLQIIPPLEIQEKLKISFDGLPDDTQRDIFLDISCFHIGKKVDRVKPILESCDLFPDSGIQILIQRCLVTVNEDNELMMHDLLRDMGRAIVSAKCLNNPGKWSRVWRREDATEVLRNESGSDEIQALHMDWEWDWLRKRPEFRTKAFEKMKRLRFLELMDVKLTGGCKYLPNKLRWLYWSGCPLKFLPKDFSLGEAVAIYLQQSKLRYVWKDARVLQKLKILDLSYSIYLKQSPDFSTIPNLEKLVLNHCSKLTKVHRSIGGLERLCLVDLRSCSNLEKLPRSFYQLKSVETLLLDGCERIEKLDEEIGGMTSLSTLSADGTAITELPSSIVGLKNLRCLRLQYPSDWKYRKFLSLRFSWGDNDRNLKMPASIQGLSSIVELRIGNCNITNLPEDLGSLSSLETLDISWSELHFESLDLQSSSINSLPSLRRLSKLVKLELRRCKNLVAIQDLPTSLRTLWAPDCTALEVMPDLSDMCNLTIMSLENCARLVEVPGLDKCLKNSMKLLVMEGCTNITATFREKILQVWNYVGPGDIFLPLSDIPEWFTWVSEGDRLKFQVPKIRGSNVMALTLRFKVVWAINDVYPRVFVTNHTKFTTFSVKLIPIYRRLDHLCLGHLPNYKFNLEGGDLVEVWIPQTYGVNQTGVSLVWDTKLPDFRVDTDLVDRFCSSHPYNYKLDGLF